MKALVTASLICPAPLTFASCSSPQEGNLDPPTDLVVNVVVGEEGTGIHVNAVTETLTGFDGLTSGFSIQVTMDAAADTFSEVKEVDDSIGLMFNNYSCVSCHQNYTLCAMS